MQSLKSKSKIKELKNTSIMIIKLIINTLLSNIILFMNNYFNFMKLIIILKIKKITIYDIIKSD